MAANLLPNMFFADFYCNNRQYILPVPLFFFPTLS